MLSKSLTWTSKNSIFRKNWFCLTYLIQWFTRPSPWCALLTSLSMEKSLCSCLFQGGISCHPRSCCSTKKTLHLHTSFIDDQSFNNASVRKAIPQFPPLRTHKCKSLLLMCTCQKLFFFEANVRSYLTFIFSVHSFST